MSSFSLKACDEIRRGSREAVTGTDDTVKRVASTLSGSRVKPDVNLITPPHPD